MPNKAIHQLPHTANRQDDTDVFYIVRSGADYKLPASSLPPRLNSAQLLISAAQMLDLYDTPLDVTAPAPPGFVHIPLRGLIEFENGTTDYQTNTIIGIGSIDGVLANAGSLIGNIDDRTKPNTMTPPCQTADTLVAATPLKVRAIESGTDPTDGDSDVRITVWYYTIPIHP